MIKPSVIAFLFLSVFINTVKAQIFWSENFDNNCASKCKVTTYTGPNGQWKDTILSTEGTTPNEWFISYSEVGEPGGMCEDKLTRPNSCLHISNSSDVGGAVYTAGAAGQTDKRVMSPTINCTGKSNVSLEFDFICFGDKTNHLDHCDVEYSLNNGNSWTVLQTNLISDACPPDAMWRTITIPFAAAANQANLKIAFRWQNQSSTAGNPSMAVDSIRFLTSNSITTGPLVPAPFCPCSMIKVPYTSSGIVFATGNTFTVELSDASGSFAAPVKIGTAAGTAVTGTVDAMIPCTTPPGTNYKVRVTSSNPAVVGTETPITISSPIKVSVTPNPDTVCMGSNITLKPTGADSYAWVTKTGTVLSTADSVKFPVLKDTTVYVVGRKGSCIDGDTIMVRAQKPPKVTVTNDTTCVGMPAVLIATGGGKYIWNTGSQNDTLFVPNQTKDTMYIVTVITGHCTVKDTGYVKVFPTITVSVNSPTICSGSVATLTATGAGADPKNYIWSTGQNTNPIMVSPTTTTTYTVTGAFGSCKDDAVATVTVSPKPDVKVATPASVCQGTSVFLHATGAKDYVWLSNGSGAVIKPPTGPDVEVITNITVTVTAVGITDGCIDSTDVVVKIDQRPNVVVNNPVICQGGTAVLVATGATKYYWPQLNDSSSTVNVNPMSDASYTVYGFNGACKDTAYAFVTVGVPVPVVASGITEIYSCESTQLFANPTDGKYSWGTVGGVEGNIDCPDCPSTKVTPINTTDYYVVYTSPKGCIGRDTIKVTVINTNSYFIPTGFTPNGDGINDVVQVHGRGIDRISLMIFDRVGEKVFETHEIEAGWDGKLHGVLMNDNVFVYKLEIYYCNGESLKETGNITMLK